MVAVRNQLSRESPADEDDFARTLAESIAAVSGAGIPYVLVGGLASALRGRERWTSDVDLLVRPHDAHPVLEALRAAGFDTEETDPAWIFKAFRDGTTIDVLFIVKGITQWRRAQARCV